MPLKIQRIARGLGDLLSTFGGQTPAELEDRVRASVDILQAYGLQQRTVRAVNDPALAEGVGLTLTFGTTWCVLFGMSATMVKTATMTALAASVALRYNADVSQETGLAFQSFEPFGATETGTVSLIWRAPFPLLVPPNTLGVGRASIIGTDATVNMTFGFDIGLLG